LGTICSSVCIRLVNCKQMTKMVLAIKCWSKLSIVFTIMSYNVLDYLNNG
jgi:murein L,D-transpeptidase YcbB/YkuD